MTSLAEAMYEGIIREQTKDLEDALRVVCVLVRKMGGAIEISDEDLLQEVGVLVRYPHQCDYGFSLILDHARTDGPILKTVDTSDDSNDGDAGSAGEGSETPASEL